MKFFSLLCGASCAAILATGSAHGATAILDVPIVVTTVKGDDLEKLGNGGLGELLYALPAVSTFGGGAYAPEFGGGIKLRGIGDPRVNLSIEGSGALYQPGNVGELWLGSRLGFTLDKDLSNVEIVGSGSLGLIGGTPSYRLGLGGEIAVLQNTDLFVEGVLGGHIGYSPTDNGIRAGLHFFPGRDMAQVDMMRGPQGTLFGQNQRVYVGGSVTAIPDASLAVPAVDFGALFGVGNNFDIGPRFSLGWQMPGSDYEAWGGGEIGYHLTPEVRAFIYGEAGTIGGSFNANRVGLGGEFQVDPSLSIVGEISMRGGWGSLTERGFKIGARYYFGGLDLDLGGLNSAPVVDMGGFTPYLGKSISAIPTGGYVIPSIDFGVTFPLESGLDAGLRGQLGYLYPAGDIEVWGGAELGFDFSSQFRGYGFVDVGSIGGFSANRLGLGGQIEVSDGWSVNLEGFGRGGLGAISEYGARGGFRVSLDGLRNAFAAAPPPP